jgi:hypothetical protein
MEKAHNQTRDEDLGVGEGRGAYAPYRAPNVSWLESLDW